jgi:hypothetical protein
VPDILDPGRLDHIEPVDGQLVTTRSTLVLRLAAGSAPSSRPARRRARYLPTRIAEVGLGHRRCPAGMADEIAEGPHAEARPVPSSIGDPPDDVHEGTGRILKRRSDGRGFELPPGSHGCGSSCR